jgi:hypothetical protein
MSAYKLFSMLNTTERMRTPDTWIQLIDFWLSGLFGPMKNEMTTEIKKSTYLRLQCTFSLPESLGEL